MSNWLAQVTAVTAFSLRTIGQRRGAVLTTALGVAGVAVVFVGVLSIAAGFRGTMRSSGAPDVAVVLRSSANGEMSSVISREEALLVADAPGLARTGGTAQSSAELFVIINLPSRSTGSDANVPLRGVGATAFTVRDNVQLVAGRRFEPGRNEIMAGVGAARAFAGLEVGRKVKLGNNEWDVVGLFSAGGGAAESELWTDAAVLQTSYQRGSSYQSVLARLATPESYQAFKDALTSNPQLKVMVQRQTEFYEAQSGALTGFIEGVGFFIAAMMALGALFGALNTMYNAVATRVREIATLRALGFGAGPVIVSVMSESLVVAIIGGAAGAGAAYLAFDGFTASTLNWQSFSQVAFAFRVTPALFAQAIALSAFIGFLGGLFPALRAARVPIAAALRET
jgi:putative ABC transport system permease protein